MRFSPCLLCYMELYNIGEGDGRIKEREDNGRRRELQKIKRKQKHEMCLKGRKEEIMNVEGSGTGKNDLLKWNFKSKNITFLNYL